MLYEGQYDIINLYPATKGMNQEIAPNLIPQEFSFYIENIMPTTHGESQVRFGDSSFSDDLFPDNPKDVIVESFAFENDDGSKQQVLYMNGFQAFNGSTNLRIIDTDTIRLTNENYALFQKDTYLLMQTKTIRGTTNPTTYEIIDIIPVEDHENTIDIKVAPNSFPNDTISFVQAFNPAPVYISDTQFSITVPADLSQARTFFVGQSLRLTVNSVMTELTVSATDISVPNTVTFTCSATPIPAFTNEDIVTLKYQSIFYIQAVDPNPIPIDEHSFSITVPMDFIAENYYFVGQKLILTFITVPDILTISAIDTSTPGTIIFTVVELAIFIEDPGNTLEYQSKTPEVINISNSTAYIKILDVATKALLNGGNQTLSNLSVACVPRAEYFAKVLWIYNGVDPIMTWDGTILQVYKEFVKEGATNFGWVDSTHFTFKPPDNFDISKYENNNTINLIIDGVEHETTVVDATQVGNLVTIETADEIPEFTGANRLVLFYEDQPPAFSFMKGANDRLWCLGPGAVGINYRVPAEALKFYYSYEPYSLFRTFNFINENTKTVPSVDISAKHGCADNLEAIVSVHGNLAFVGRQHTQVWSGYDPRPESVSNTFSWIATLPVGIYHGNLIVELANDTYFFSPNGFLSVSTFNIARQFGATSTNNMDKLAAEYAHSIQTNRDYRACRAFKYDNGGFCGFKIGQNNIIVSRFHTSLYWWTVFSGDFAKAATFMSSLNDALYLYIGKRIYTYADGLSGKISYGDNDGNDLISFSETKYVNNIKGRYANKRYEIQCDYSSDVLINPNNDVKIYIRGDLKTSFTLSDQYSLQQRGDVLGTINLANGEDADPNNPNNPKILKGYRLESPFQNIKGRLKFVSSNFTVSLVGKTKDGPFSLKKIRLFGFMER